MDDLIRRQDALELDRDVCDAIMSCCGNHYDEETEDEVYDDIHEVDAILKCNKEISLALRNMPSAQPEIVRCKDCMHNQCKSTSGNALCKLFYGMTDQMGYCHMAERREE